LIERAHFFTTSHFRPLSFHYFAWFEVETYCTCEVNVAHAMRHALELFSLQAEETLKEQLRQQHERLFAEAEADKDAVCKRLVHELQEDKRAALAALRQDLEALAENRISTMLSEQRHDLLAEASKERAEALEALRRELDGRESRNLEALKAALTAEHGRVVRSLEERIRTVEHRAASDLQEAAHQHQLDLERALADQRRELTAEANRERKLALELLETNLTAKFTAKNEELRRELLRKHADEMAASGGGDSPPMLSPFFAVPMSLSLCLFAASSLRPCTCASTQPPQAFALLLPCFSRCPRGFFFLYFISCRPLLTLVHAWCVGVAVG
jgi:hypothetical protein